MIEPVGSGTWGSDPILQHGRPHPPHTVPSTFQNHVVGVSPPRFLPACCLTGCPFWACVCMPGEVLGLLLSGSPSHGPDESPGPPVLALWSWWSDHAGQAGQSYRPEAWHDHQGLPACLSWRLLDRAAHSKHPPKLGARAGHLWAPSFPPPLAFLPPSIHSAWTFGGKRGPSFSRQPLLLPALPLPSTWGCHSPSVCCLGTASLPFHPYLLVLLSVDSSSSQGSLPRPLAHLGHGYYPQAMCWDPVVNRSA